MGDRRQFQIIFLDRYMDQDSRALADHRPDINPTGDAWLVGQTSDTPLPFATADIISNQLRVLDDGLGSTRFISIDMGESDGFLELLCFVGNNINPTWPHLMFRKDGIAAKTGWLLRQNAESDVLQLFRPSTNQSFPVLTSETLVSGPNDKILLQAQFVGDQIECHGLNITTGAEAYLSFTDSENENATRHGLGIRTTFAAGSGDRFDNIQFSKLFA